MMLIRYLVAVLMLGSMHSVLAGYGTAAAAGYSKTVSGYTMNAGKGATAANGAYHTPATISMAGRMINVGTAAGYAANAAQFVVTAARMTPQTMVVGAIAAWLLQEGLQWANNSWTKTSTGSYPVFYTNTSQGTDVRYDSAQLACNAVTTGTTAVPYSPYAWECGAYVMVYGYCQRPGTFSYLNDPACSAGAVTAPAQESDFTAAGNRAMPDAVAQQMYDVGQPLPIQTPALDPVPVDAPLGNPYVDPTTGKTVQQKARITPMPTAEDPFRVQMTPYQVDVSAAPAPLPGDPVPSPKDEQPKDPCLDNPSRIGCLDSGSPEDSTLQTQAVSMVLTPVIVGNAGSCPANKTFSAMGKQMTFSYQPICTGANLMRPVVLALAWLIAAYIVVGAMREFG